MQRDTKEGDGQKAEARALGTVAIAWLAGFGALALASPPADLVTAGTVVLSLPTLVGVTLAGRSAGWWGQS